MLRLAKATEPYLVKGAWPLIVGYGLALWVVSVSVAQMISFEEFVNALQGYGFASQQGAVAIAIAVLALEVFSVAYLLRLRLSRAARYISGLFVLAVPCAWLVLSLLGMGAVNAGYFGGFMKFSVNGWAIALDVAWMLAAAACFCMYGEFKVKGK